MLQLESALVCPPEVRSPRAFKREAAFHSCSLQSHQSLIPTFICSCSLPSPSATVSRGLSEPSRKESKTSKGNGAFSSRSRSNSEGEIQASVRAAHKPHLGTFLKHKSKQKGRPQVNPELAPAPEGMLPTEEGHKNPAPKAECLWSDMQAVASLT